MKSLLKAILYLSFYLAVVYIVIWFLVIKLEHVEAKMQGAVDVYYQIWSVFYSPVALYSVFIMLRSKLPSLSLVLRAGFTLILIGVAVLVSFYLDLHWIWLILEYGFFIFISPYIFCSPIKFRNSELVSVDPAR